jgi:hypothetical protein
LYQQQKIDRFFINHRAGLRRKKNNGARSQDAHDPVACFEAITKLSKALVSLKSDEAPDGRELFRVQWDAAIKDKARLISTGNTAGDYQAAQKILWDMLGSKGQSDWHEKARKECDIFT